RRRDAASSGKNNKRGIAWRPSCRPCFAVSTEGSDMRHLREWLDRAIGAFYQRRRDDDLEQELAAHVALAQEAAERRGDSTSGAHRAARVRSGGTTQAMEALRD